MMTYNRGLGYGKLFFALLIPFLHIPFSDSVVIEILRQYVARLGVPFFFAASGYLLAESCNSRGSAQALKRYLIRVGILIGAWLILYCPLYIGSYDFRTMPIRILLFKTPCYLWYLSALLVAAVPFCLVKKRKALYVSAGVLYVIGTMFCGSYSSLFDEWTAYTNIFLTTRNGVFFALPLMCTGEIVLRFSKEHLKWKPKYGLWFVISFVIFGAEVFLCRQNVSSSADCSMYFTLPFITAFSLLFFITHFKGESDTASAKDKFINKWSSAIYLSQYGVIQVGGYYSND